MTDGTPEVLEETRRVSDEFPHASLDAYLRANLPLPDAPLSIEQFPHGHSNLTFLLRCGDTRWVLRRPPGGHVAATAHDMRREFRFMSVLYAAYPLAPRSFLLCEDPDVIGAPFHVIEYRRGVILRPRPAEEALLDAAGMRALCRDLIDALARLHAVDYAAIGLADAGKPTGYAARQVSGWVRRYRESETNAVPELDEVAAWLAEHVPPDAGAGVVHNDFKFDNLLLDPADLTRIVGVVDWEMSTLGDPLMDLGTTLGFWLQPDDPVSLRAVRPGPTLWPGCLTRTALVDEYRARSGRSVDDPVFYYCYGLFKLAAIFQQSYARYVRGDTADPRFADYDQKILALARQAARTLEAGRV